MGHFFLKGGGCSHPTNPITHPPRPPSMHLEETQKLKQQPSSSSHLNKGTENVRTKYKSKNKLLDDTHPLSPHPHSNINQICPTYPILPSFDNRHGIPRTNETI